VSKVLESAAANAVNNRGLDEDRLYVHETFVNEGMTLKRWSPSAYGRAGRIRKRTSHITVAVRERRES
jgi:large subunit ribosomal protein L22